MSEIRDMSESGDSEVVVRFSGGSHRKDPNIREHILSMSMKFPEGTDRKTAKAVLSELVRKKLAVTLEDSDE